MSARRGAAATAAGAAGSEGTPQVAKEATLMITIQVDDDALPRVREWVRAQRDDTQDGTGTHPRLLYRGFG